MGANDFDFATLNGYGYLIDLRDFSLNFKQKALDYKEAFDVRKANGLYGDEDRLPPVLGREKEFFIEFQKVSLAIGSTLASENSLSTE